MVKVRSLPRPLNLFKNLAVVPKACWIARICEREGIGHVHAHWLSSSATAALVVHLLQPEIPFSLTAHRGDIDLRNMIPTKVARAAFVRCGDSAAAAEVRAWCPSRGVKKSSCATWGPISPPSPLR
jgi:hypothetical protein